jgi:hypothetical protein
VHRLAPRRLHLADRDQLIAERLERLHHRLELEVAADLRRVPGIGIHAARQVDHAKPERRGGGSAALSRQCRHHRVEEGQGHRGAEGTPQERAT